MRPSIETAGLLVIDEDQYTLSLLLAGLREAGFKHVAGCTSARLVADYAPDLVVFNFHATNADARKECQFVKLLHPQVTLLLLISPGEASRQVEKWADKAALVDGTLSKPLREGLLASKIKQLLTISGQTLSLQQRNRNLASILPHAAVAAAEDTGQSAQLHERAILFTDVRGSTKLIERIDVVEFFAGLNQSLTAQGEVVRTNQGEVIKFTGDGMLAVFTGMGRVHLALRCALALQALDSAQAEQAANIRFGIGLADGLVLSGFVGDSTRRQYDVIGKNVHLAARLCSLATAGQIVLTESTLGRAYLPVANVTAMGELAIKGFSQAIRCCVINSTPSQN